jgi:phosphohistidine swiveling domain-containing protein
MSRDAYLQAYGHRGPHEFELSVPRPAEDPGWLDRELASFRAIPVDVDALLAKHREAFDAAWARFRSRYPRKADAMARRLTESGRRVRLRELARSAYVRDRWMVRLFARHVGELTGLGDDVFFLTLAEMLDLLSGDEPPIPAVSARKETYRRYKSLPPYPSVIRGQFDPFRWAADGQRRSDIFDGRAPFGATARDRARPDVITGSPGSAGRAEGVVRCLASPEEGQLFRQGEVLVAVQTDIAWTLIFPRAAAVVTDVGAPLSHAAIVARELGIPAVVGCGDATARLKTGDRVRVDGGAGTVIVIRDS